jgi:alkylhydroperoxidase family enzyme
MPALPPLTDAEWPKDLTALLAGFAGKLNVYRVMAYHPGLLKSWETLRNHVVLDNALGLVDQEIVILRAGFRWGSGYELAHHIVRGRAAGLSEDRIGRAWLPATAITGKHPDDILMQCVDDLVDHGRLTREHRDSLMARFGAKGALDLMATVGMYSTLAFILETFEVPIDAGIAEQAARPPA